MTLGGGVYSSVLDCSNDVDDGGGGGVYVSNDIVLGSNDGG